MILCLGATPAAQRVMIFSKLALDAVNRAATTQEGVAGKSLNVAKVLKSLGERPIATGFLGGPRGEWLRESLEARGIEAEFVRVAAATRECVTVIDEATGEVTELVEESKSVDGGEYEKLLGVVGRRLSQCRALVMSGTIPPGGPVEFYFKCVRLASEAGILSVVDAQGEVLKRALEGQPGLVKPNRLELAATTGRCLDAEEAALSAIRELHAQGAQRVVVTAGGKPTLAFDGARFWRITSPRVAAVNPIGSGDAFAAGLAWRLLRGDDLGEACRWASACGAANALTSMAGEVDRAEVERLHTKAVVEELAV